MTTIRGEFSMETEAGKFFPFYQALPVLLDVPPEEVRKFLIAVGLDLDRSSKAKPLCLPDGS